METAAPRAKRATCSELLDVIERKPLGWWHLHGADVAESAELLWRAFGRLAIAPSREGKPSAAGDRAEETAAT